jgi:hypothetical protein
VERGKKIGRICVATYCQTQPHLVSTMLPARFAKGRAPGRPWITARMKVAGSFAMRSADRPPNCGAKVRVSINGSSRFLGRRSGDGGKPAPGSTRRFWCKLSRGHNRPPSGAVLRGRQHRIPDSHGRDARRSAAGRTDRVIDGTNAHLLAMRVAVKSRSRAAVRRRRRT